MFIQTEATPNPATLKFLPGRVVLEDGTADFRDANSAREASLLAGALFDVPGVAGVFFGYDFVTVTKQDGPDWQHLKPAILGAIMEHFMSGLPVMAQASSVASAAAAEENEEFYDKGTVFLHMKGACAGCPSSTATLKHGIQNLLRHFVPEVEHVEQIS